MKNVIMDYIFHTKYYAKKISRKPIKSPINNIDYPYFNSLYNQGHNILYGEIELCGRKYNFIDFSDTNLLPESIVVELHKFYWIINLLVLDTKESIDKITSLVETWVHNHGKISYPAWNIDVLSERVFHLILCHIALEEKSNHFFANMLKVYLDQQINHLIFAYTNYYYNNKIKIYQALIMVSIFYEEYQYLLSEVFNLIIEDIKNQINLDGGHKSRDCYITLLYLEDLLKIYYCIKDIKSVDSNNLLEYIGRIAAFIRTMRHLDGKLSLFNGSYESNNQKIDFLLSLSKLTSESSNQLRNSGYINMETKHSKLIVDVGTPLYNYNSLLAFEISMGKHKIITNNGNNNYIYQLQQQDPLDRIDGRLDNTCIILKSDNETLLFPFSPATIKIERRQEDNWEIFSINYTGLKKEYNLSYHQTIYLSTKHNRYILGESLLTFDGVNKGITEAFLLFNLHHNIKYLDLIQDGHLVTMQIGDESYIFYSENKIQVQKKFYRGQEGESIKSYSLMIPFNLKDKRIKNEWNVSPINNIYGLNNE